MKIVEKSIIACFVFGVALIGHGLYLNSIIIKVGVLDTGVEATHSIFKNKKIKTSSVSQFYSEQPTISHGTHVAGIIAKRTDNETEIHSIKNIFTDETPLIPLYSGFTDNKFLKSIDYLYKKDLDFETNFEDFSKAIEYAHKNEIRILNISQNVTYELNDEEFNKIYSVFKKSEDYGILIVVASGNERYNLDSVNKMSLPFPCGLELSNIICVGNVDKELNVRSNYGKSVDIFAMGVDVVSSVNENMYSRSSGSSQAAPKISALIARIWSQNKTDNYTEVKAKLLRKLAFDPKLQNVSKTGKYLKDF